MKRWGWMAGMVAGIAGVLPSAAAPVTLKLATVAPEGSAWMQAFERVKKAVDQATGGQVKIKVYPGGVMGADKDVLFKIKTGMLDGAGFLGDGIGRICPDARALMVPLTFRDEPEARAVFAALQPLMEAQLDKEGYLALGWVEDGFSYLLGTVPVRNLADLRAAKPWSVPNEEMLSALFEVAGVTGIPVQVSDVLPGLQSGLLQTVYAPPLGAVALQWHTRVKHRLDLPMTYVFEGVFLSRKAWDRIPEDFRGPVRDIVRKEVAALGEQLRKSNAEALEVMRKQGVEALVPEAPAVAEFEARAAEAFQRLTGKLFSPEAAAQVRAAVQAQRAAAAGTGTAHAP